MTRLKQMKIPTKSHWLLYLLGPTLTAELSRKASREKRKFHLANAKKFPDQMLLLALLGPEASSTITEIGLSGGHPFSIHSFFY